MSVTEATMGSVAATDWEAIEWLGASVEFPTERVTLLRRRLDGERGRPGAPLTLLVGRPDAGIEQFVGRLFGSETLSALEATSPRPLVIGPAPETVRPRLSSWPTLASSLPQSGHVIILRTTGVPPADVMAGLAGLGMIDQVVLVGLLLQAMHEREREILAVLPALAATARCVLVWRPGEEPTEADLQEVVTATSRQIQGRGFEGVRDRGVSVLFTGEPAGKLGSLTDPSKPLRVDDAAVAASRDGLERAALSDLLNAIYRRAGEAATAASPGITPEERDRLVRELASYLADLGRETGRAAAEKPGADAAWVRRYVLDAIKGWAAYTGIEGHWLRYVETLRPGTQAALIAGAEKEADSLDYRPTPVPAQASDSSGALPSRLMLEAKRVAIGLSLGLATYAGVSAAVKLRPIVDIVVGLSSLALGSILGYMLGWWIFPGTKKPTAAVLQADRSETGSPPGWTQFERRLVSLFAEMAQSRPTSPVEACRDLARRLGVTLKQEVSE